MSWSKKSANGYVVLSEDLTLPDSDGANEATINSSTILDDINNSKLVVYLIVTETCAGDGALDIRVQGSLDGTTFVNILTTVSMDVDPTGENSAAAKIDLTDYFVPYWRLQVFSDQTDTEDSAGLTVKVAYKE